MTFGVLNLFDLFVEPTKGYTMFLPSEAPLGLSTSLVLSVVILDTA